MARESKGTWSRLLARLRPPGPEVDPRETLLWVRCAEIVGGTAAILVGLILLSEGWWGWILIVIGIINLVPWGGARTILRKAERDPDVLVADPAERRARGRRAMLALIPVNIAAPGIMGYLIDGWAAAIPIAAVCAVGSALGAWWYLRAEESS